MHILTLSKDLMKNIRFVVASLLVILSFLHTNYPLAIVEYDQTYKDTLVDIAFQDPELFFPGYRIIPESLRNTLYEALKQELCESFEHPLKYKKVLIDKTNNVLGFAVYFKTNEELMRTNPGLKRTNAECQEYVLLESIAINKEHRKKGYGKMLLHTVLEAYKKEWPTLTTIKLNVDKDNTVARSFYESEGFIMCDSQPLYATMQVVQYEKTLN